MVTGSNSISAVNDFHQARTQARLEQLLARLSGESADLLCYEEVRRYVKASSGASKGLHDIPIDAIVGSVGRCDTFTRGFYPRQDQDRDRWTQIEMMMTGMTGLPPIEVYKIGDVYFVVDGNHRVSVAKQLGATHIQAYVTEFKTEVPLTPDVQPDDLIVKAEHAAFLADTHLHEVRPQADLSMTMPGHYQELKEQIDVHRYFMGIDQNRPVRYKEAVAHWYDHVYKPVIHVIHEQGVMEDFPELTETDLYLWILKHRDQLGGALSWEIQPEEAANDLASRFSPRLRQVLKRLFRAIKNVVVPSEIKPGPPPGSWRHAQRYRDRHDRLFGSVIVALEGAEATWHAVDQAIEVAKRENGRVIGMHVMPDEATVSNEVIHMLKQAFINRCEAAGVACQWVLETGRVTPRICEQGRWIDLVVVKLNHPPGDQPISRLSSGFRSLVQRCPTPILTVVKDPTPMERTLLAYDGSPKAKEALFVSTYLANAWETSLSVVTVTAEEEPSAEAAEEARSYLQNHGVGGQFIEKEGPVGEAVLEAARETESELIVMGGYGFNPVLQIVLGSAVDHVLRASDYPVLICR